VALGVLAELAEVERDARLVADDLRVVTRRRREDIARADLRLSAVVHDDLHPARDHVAEM
jgi:hypothetical protein